MPYHSPLLGYYGTIPIQKSELRGLSLSTSMSQFEAKIAGFKSKINPQSTDFLTIKLELFVDNPKLTLWVNQFEGLPTNSQLDLNLNGLLSVPKLIIENLEVSMYRSISSQVAITDTTKNRLQLFEVSVTLTGCS